MGLWKWLFASGAPARHGEPVPPDDGTVQLPAEPYVFECRECGKVFERRRRRAVCPECDSTNVELMSE